MAKNDISVIIGGDIDELVDSLNEAKKRTEDVTGAMSASFGQVAAAVTGLVAGARVIGGGVSAFSEMSDSLLQAKAAGKLTTDQIEALKQKALELGGEPAQTPLDVAAAMAVGQKAGQSFAETMGSIEANAQLAAGSEMSLADSVKETGKVMSQFGLDAATSTQQIVDVTLKAADSAAVSATQIFESMRKVGGVADMLGYSYNQTAAALVGMAKQSVVGEEAGTGLRGVMAGLLDKSDKLSESFGVQVYAMQNGQQVVRSLADIMDDLKGSGASVQDMFEIFGRESMPAVTALLKVGGDGLRQFESDLDSAAGTGERVSSTLQSDVGGSLRTISSDLQVASMKIGEVFVPAVNLIAEYSGLAGKAVDFLTGTVDSMAASVTASLGVVVAGFGKLAKITDSIGATEGLGADVAAFSAAAFASANDLADKANAAFDRMKGKVAEVKVEEAGLAEATKGTQAATESAAAASESRVGAVVSGIKKITEKEKKLKKEREETVAAMYKEMGMAGDAYFKNEAQKVLKFAEKMADVGASELEQERYKYQKLTALSEQAWASQSAEAGKYLDGLTVQYSAAGAMTDDYYASKLDAANRSAEASISAGEKEVDALRDQLQELEALKEEAAANSSTGTLPAISDAIAEIKAEIEAVNAEEVEINADSSGAKEEIASVGAAVDGISGRAASIPVNADGSKASSEIKKVESELGALDGQEATVSINADTSGMERMTGSIRTNMLSVEELQSRIAKFNATPTLDPFGESRKKYQEQLNGIQEVQNQLKNASAEERAEIAKNSDFISEEEKKRINIAAESAKKRQELIGKIAGAEQKVQEAITKQQEYYAKQRYEKTVNSLESRIAAIKEHEDKRKEYLTKRISAIEDNAKKEYNAQVSSLEKQIASIKKAESLRKDYLTERITLIEGNARKSYQIQVDSIEKQLKAERKANDEKKRLLQDQIDDIADAQRQKDNLLSAYQQMASDDDQFIDADLFRAEADAITRQAQEWADQGVSAAKIARWMSSQLSDINKEAKAAGIGGIEDYTESLMQAYRESGLFSKSIVDARIKTSQLTGVINTLSKGTDALAEKLDDLKEVGAEGLYPAAFAETERMKEELESLGHGSDELQDKLEELKELGAGGLYPAAFAETEKMKKELESLGHGSDALQEKLEEWKEFGAEGMYPAAFQQTGLLKAELESLGHGSDALKKKLESVKSSGVNGFMPQGVSEAQRLSNAVLSAKNNVESLKNSLSSLSSKAASVSSSSKSWTFGGKSSGRKGYGYSYEGGGYTWAGPRSGGTDGKGGKTVNLHPDEVVVDLKSPEKGLRDLQENLNMKSYGGGNAGAFLPMAASSEKPAAASTTIDQERITTVIAEALKSGLKSVNITLNVSGNGQSNSSMGITDIAVGQRRYDRLMRGRNS